MIVLLGAALDVHVRDIQSHLFRRALRSPVRPRYRTSHAEPVGGRCCFSDSQVAEIRVATLRGGDRAATEPTLKQIGLVIKT